MHRPAMRPSLLTGIAALHIGVRRHRLANNPLQPRLSGTLREREGQPSQSSMPLGAHLALYPASSPHSPVERLGPVSQVSQRTLAENLSTRPVPDALMDARMVIVRL